MFSALRKTSVTVSDLTVTSEEETNGLALKKQGRASRKSAHWNDQNQDPELGRHDIKEEVSPDDAKYNRNTSKTNKQGKKQHLRQRSNATDEHNIIIGGLVQEKQAEDRETDSDDSKSHVPLDYVKREVLSVSKVPDNFDNEPESFHDLKRSNPRRSTKRMGVCYSSPLEQSDLMQLSEPNSSLTSATEDTNTNFLSNKPNSLQNGPSLRSPPCPAALLAEQITNQSERSERALPPIERSGYPSKALDRPGLPPIVPYTKHAFVRSHSDEDSGESADGSDHQQLAAKEHQKRKRAKRKVTNRSRTLTTHGNSEQSIDIPTIEIT